MSVCQAVTDLVNYGCRKGLLDLEDKPYTINLLLDVLKLDFYEYPEYRNLQAELLKEGNTDLETILQTILSYAANQGLIEEDSVVYRDLFDTKIMNCLLPRPSEVVRRFYHYYSVSPKRATEYYYQFCIDSDYIRSYRISKDLKWVVDTEYGDLDITINLSKPEKDPKAIAAALKKQTAAYPKCLLCRENEGYAGRVDHPARENHRIIPITIGGARWYLQYSPYVYYNEHCIVLNETHTPMVINKEAFRKLLDFVTLFPHYFVGSNADLPIVGGSILTHEHFQGGCYEFPMAKALATHEIVFPAYPSVKAGIVDWPMPVIRLASPDKEAVADLADEILGCWQNYTDESAYIYACTNSTPHNTINPIARRRGENYELDLVLRNNITTKEHPDGLYHPHKEFHHIKKENIGLIEVMGLAILPARLKVEMELLKECILAGKPVAGDERLAKQAEWADHLKNSYTFTASNIDSILQQEIGRIFKEILCQCGVFKRDSTGLLKFGDFIRAAGGIFLEVN